MVSSTRNRIAMMVLVVTGLFLSLVVIGMIASQNQQSRADREENSRLISELKSQISKTGVDMGKGLWNMRRKFLRLNGWLGATGEILYKKFNKTLLFNDSKAECERHGAHLVAEALRRPEEITYMLEQRLLPRTGGEDIWIGYTNIEEEANGLMEKNCKWVDGGTTNSKTVYWGPNKQDGCETAWCAKVHGMNGAVLQLSGGSCYTDYYRFICEIRA